MSVFIIVLSNDDVKIIEFVMQNIFTIPCEWIAFLYVSLNWLLMSNYNKYYSFATYNNLESSVNFIIWIQLSN